MKRPLFLLMLAASPGFGQARPASSRPPQRKPATPAPVSTRWPVETISIEGNHLYTAAQVIAVTGLKIGQLAGKEEFDNARDRLVATGAFETVGYRFAPAPTGQGYAATFQVTEVEPAYPVRFEELGVPDQDAAAALRAKDPLFGAKIPATRAILDRYTKWLQEFLASRNITGKVAGRVTATGPDQFEVLFRPARILPAVAQVTFDGNQVIPSNLLRDAIGGVAIGQPYTEEAFRGLLTTAVRPLYEARGRVRVAFPKIRTEPAKDVQGLNVFVTVTEGESYDLGEIEIAGATPVKPADLIKAANLKPGDLANFDTINQGLDRVRAAVRRAGFMQVKVTADRKIDDAKKTVGLALHIDPGPQYTMGKLAINGLDLHGESEVKRLWTLKEGKPFNADYPDYFLARVREQGLFEGLGKTRSVTKVDEQNRSADVTLYFGAAPPEPDPRSRRPADDQQQPPPGQGPPI
jgi:outer membrane protein insertion porin family